MDAAIIRIRSRTHPHVVYEIRGGKCQCPASAFRRRCWHIAAAKSMRELGLVSAETR